MATAGKGPEVTTKGPLWPLLEDDGPACRVCSCTEHNACVEIGNVPLTVRIAKAVRMPVPLTGVACSWVKTDVRDVPRPLCSACSGTEADMVNSIERGVAILRGLTGPHIANAVLIGEAALARKKAREASKGA